MTEEYVTAAQLLDEGTLVKSVVDDVDQTRERARVGELRATVRGRVSLLAATVASIAANSMKKGDVLGTARFAGVQAAKQTASLVPRVPAVRIGAARVAFRLGRDTIDIEASLEGDDELGATMAAFSAVMAAALTIYDMCKSADRTMVIGPVALAPGADVDESAPGP